MCVCVCSYLCLYVYVCVCVCSRLQNFGLSTNTFGVDDFPDIPAPSEGEDVPALVFINPVDPTIPISSNTLPLRGKLRLTNKSGNLKSHFSGKESFKGFKSTGSINKVGMGSAEPLVTDIKLLEQFKDKDKSDNKYKEKVSNSDYGFLLKTDDDIKVSTFMSPASSSLYDVPKRVLKEPMPETIAETSLASKAAPVSKIEFSNNNTVSIQMSSEIANPAIKERRDSSTILLPVPNPVIPEAQAPDRSHYDVPKKLIEQARARHKQDVSDKKQAGDAQIKDKEISTAKENGTSSLDKSKATKPYVNVTLLAPPLESSTAAVKKEGIYDVPRPVKANSKSKLLPNDAKPGDDHSRVKPKVASRTMKLTTLTELDKPKTEEAIDKKSGSSSTPPGTIHLDRNEDSKSTDKNDVPGSDSKSINNTEDTKCKNEPAEDKLNAQETATVTGTSADESLVRVIAGENNIAPCEDTAVPQEQIGVKNVTLGKPKVMARSGDNNSRPKKPPVPKAKPNPPPRRAAPKATAS